MKSIIISENNSSKTNNGIFEGWGTSLCWWAHRVGFSKKLTEKSASLFFSENGLNLNIMRYNIGGGDDPTHNHITRTDSEIPGWWKYNTDSCEFDFDTDVDKNQLAVLEAAYSAAKNNAYVEAFSNSPPFFMTESGCSSGNYIASKDNLKKSCIADFAEYLAKVCFYIQNEYKIEIKSLAPMNEPFSNYWKAFSTKQEGCFVSPGEMQSNILKAVDTALRKKNLHNTVLTASDETNTMLQYISVKMLSEDALATVDRISTHTYMKALPHIKELALTLNKNLWMSETDWSGVCGENSGEMGPALWLAEKIIEDINTLSPSAWVIWQIVAAYISKEPDCKGRFDMSSMPDLTKGFWGTAFADIDNEDIYLTQKYYAFGQFSRYIKPGMSIIHTNCNYCIAALNKDTNETVLVITNSNKDVASFSFKFTDIDIKNKKAKIIRTSGDIQSGEHWSNVGEFEISENEFDINIKGHSITTLVIS